MPELGIIAALVALAYAGYKVYVRPYSPDSMSSNDNNPLVVASVVPATPPPVAPTSPVQQSSAPTHPKIADWAKAIAQWEGANPASNNPGNMKYTTLTASWGAMKGHPASDGGYLCQFKTYQAGLTALCNFLTLGAEGQLIISHPESCTLEAFTKRFAGNPPQGYIDGICKELGLSPTTLISTFLVG